MFMRSDEIDIGELLQEIDAVDLDSFLLRDFLHIRHFLEEIDYIHAAVQYLESNPVMNIRDLHKAHEALKSALKEPYDRRSSDRYMTLYKSSWNFLERLVELDDRSLQSIIENELRQEVVGRETYKQMVPGIRSRYSEVSSVMQSQRVNGRLEKALEEEMEEELEREKSESMPFISRNEISRVMFDLSRYTFVHEVDLRCEFGFDPLSPWYEREKTLQELQANNGVARGILFWKEYVIDDDVIASLGSIAAKDPDHRVSGLAQEMVETYNQESSFKQN